MRTQKRMKRQEKRKRHFLSGVFLGAALLLAACGTAPAKNFEALQATPPEKILKSPAEALKRNPPQGELKDRVSLDFSAKDPVLFVDGKITPFKTLKVTLPKADWNYLAFYGYFHLVGYGKGGAIMPRVYIFDANGKDMKVSPAQIGDEPMCGLYRCMKFVYNVKGFKPGEYSLVIASYVSDPQAIVGVAKADTMTYAAGIMIPLHTESPTYADYFGSLDVLGLKQLPFKADRAGVQTFEKALQ